MVGGRMNSKGIQRKGKPFLGQATGTPAFQTTFQDFGDIVQVFCSPTGRH